MSEFDEKNENRDEENKEEIIEEYSQVLTSEDEPEKIINREAGNKETDSGEPKYYNNAPQQPPRPTGTGYYAPPQPPYYRPNQPQPPQKPSYVYYGDPSLRNNAPQTEYKPMHTNEKGKKSGRLVFVSIISIIAVVAIILSVITVKGTGKKEQVTEKVDAPTIAASDTANKSEGVAAQANTEGALDAVSIYQKVKDASVGILVYSANTSKAAGEGSGVIIGEGEGGKYTYIITCAHVVANSSSVKVQLSDDSQYSARVVGSDARTDIAVLRIEKTGLTKMEIGKSDDLTVGETVYAIGNPGGIEFAGSFTNGIVSAIARPISSEIGYEMVCIQHTAAINPGNSGGALVNQYGQLIGINSSKIASTDYEGMGFAVPSSTFVEVYNEIIANGYVTNRPMLGITYLPASESQTYSMLIGASGLPEGAIIIQTITADSSLNEQGVKPNDLIIKVNGEDMQSIDTLQSLVEKSKIGDKIKLTICRFNSSNYQPEIFEVEATLVEDKGNNIVEQTTQAPQFNPFGNYDFGN